MPWFSNLKISSKFNVITLLVFIALLVSNAVDDYLRQQSLSIKGAVDNARSIARQIIETRDYMSSVVKGEPETNYALVPQVVATQVAKKVTSGSKFYVRQVSLRYRNPENRPDEYESRRLRQFAGKSVKESYEVLNLKGGKVFRYMLPMLAEKSCLECHGSYENAPLFVRKRFPPGHYSYNYKIGETIGAVSVSIPMVDLYKKIGTNLKLDLAYISLIFLMIIIIMRVLIRKNIIGPITMLSESISRVARTGSFAERLPISSSDEIGGLISAFNDMMEELDRKTQQSRESEERYRRFIEMARSAVVTFMLDGKIVISNKKAEDLFGLSKQQLLGENIFDFIVNGETLRQWMTRHIHDGKGQWAGEVTRQVVRNVKEEMMEVEMAISASQNEQRPIITAILRLDTNKTR